MYDAHAELLRQSNQAGVQFLLTDTQAGLTFLKVAQTTAEPENRERSLKKARLAYDTVLRLLPRVMPDPEEKLQLEQKLAELKSGLAAAGNFPKPKKTAAP